MIEGCVTNIFCDNQSVVRILLNIKLVLKKRIHQSHITTFDGMWRRESSPLLEYNPKRTSQTRLLSIVQIMWGTSFLVNRPNKVDLGQHCPPNSRVTSKNRCNPVNKGFKGNHCPQEPYTYVLKY